MTPNIPTICWTIRRLHAHHVDAKTTTTTRIMTFTASLTTTRAPINAHNHTCPHATTKSNLAQPYQTMRKQTHRSHNNPDHTPESVIHFSRFFLVAAAPCHRPKWRSNTSLLNTAPDHRPRFKVQYFLLKDYALPPSNLKVQYFFAKYCVWPPQNVVEREREREKKSLITR